MGILALVLLALAARAEEEMLQIPLEEVKTSKKNKPLTLHSKTRYTEL